MTAEPLRLFHSRGQVSLSFDGVPMVTELGAGVPIDGRWRWTFDGSLSLTEQASGSGSDQDGDYETVTLTYSDDAGPVLRQQMNARAEQSYLVFETTTLRDLSGTSLEDSFFHTTFNSPVVRLADHLSFLTYTWGLQGGEGVGIGGHFPDGVVATDLSSLSEKLRMAGFSPTADIHQTSEKPFAPLIAYDEQECTLVMSPLDHLLISPLRLIDTPQGTGIARGLHGAVDSIPTGTTTQTLLVFGPGLVPTMLKWGDLLLQRSGKARRDGHESTLVKKLGFWNCYGSYYAELFRQTNEETLLQLARYYKEADIPVRYIGLDLWYYFDRVGFARDYRPDPVKYSRGLKAMVQETGLPPLLHMSAFDSVTEHQQYYEFVVDEGSAYPARPDFYQDRAREYRDWGALGIWPDFLRTQLQNSRSLRARLGVADQWFDGLCRAMGQEGLDVMLCMPTVGHYLASTAYSNVNSVRTSTDYVNHQPGQLEILSRTVEEYRIPNTSQHNLRQNLMLSLLAGALGLAPSYDVFITNRDHPEGFAEPEAAKQALARALSAGIVGIGDKVGEVDKSIVDRLAFPDGTLAQPDHPPYPVVATLPAEVPAFYTTTTIADFCWTYIALYNLSGGEGEYRLDLRQFLREPDDIIYDYLTGQFIPNAVLEGRLTLGEYRYVVLPPKVGELYLLGFLDKYVTVSGRQVKGVSVQGDRVAISLELPAGRSYTFAVIGAEEVQAEGTGISGIAVEHQGSLDTVKFTVESPNCVLMLKVSR
jgi:hypothetical protein